VLPLPNQALQRTAATELVCQGVRFQRLPRPLSLGVRRGGHKSMASPSLNLVVLRSSDLCRTAQFYAALGIQFARERHGAGPEHLAACLGDIVLEFYPQENGAVNVGVRVGFRVQSVSEAVRAIQETGGSVLTQARESTWGLRAVVADPDGHRVELVEEIEPAEPGAAADRGNG
jgi:lactoylglutathione lyase